MKKAIKVPTLFKDVLDDHGLCGNRVPVFLNLAEKLTADPFFTLDDCADALCKEKITTGQMTDVYAALEDLQHRKIGGPLSFN